MESTSSRLMWLIGLVVLAVQFQIILCTGCLEQERTALLQIKASMSQYSYPPYTTFPESWDSAGYDEGGGSSDCCGWKGVECNITTGKVIKLVLYRASYGWPLNASMFLPFKDLTHLDLTENFIRSWVPNQGLGRLSVLPKLHALILDGNNFKNSVLSSLGELSSLRTLSLSGNLLEGTFDLGGFHNMTNLYELDLHANSINSLKGLGRLSVLPNLHTLRLDDNNFNNSVLPSLGELSSLSTLSLSSNHFEGTFDFGGFHNMTNLYELDLGANSINSIKGLETLSKLTVLNLGQMELNESSSILQSVSALRSLKTLDMSNNHFKGVSFANASIGSSNLVELDLSLNDIEGMIPSWLRNFTSLRFLDLSSNHFGGNLALSPIADLNALECLVISDNDLEIPASLISFYNHSKLKVLITDNNRRLISDKVEFHIPRVIPKFQLQLLSFSNCGSKNLIIGLPDFFHYQSDLRIVDLSRINLVVPFPNWLLENNTLLEQCVMRNNSLTGTFLLPSHTPFPQTTVIDISDNGLVGQVMENIGQIFPGLLKLDMSGNQLGGRVPTSIGKLEYLKILDLSNNYLSGEIPTIVCPSLRFLKMSHNKLSGQVSSSIYNLTALVVLYLDDNHFVGEIPNSFPAFSLEILDLSNNHILGKLPRWIENMTELSSVAMASNYLEGFIPVEFCNFGSHLLFLDLSNNSLSGSIPSCFNPPVIKHVHLNRNKLSGPMTLAFYNCSSLVSLDLLDNSLTGTIPSWLGNLSSLSVLLLKLNNFEGQIPLQLCNLKRLSLLDLSYNSLVGLLPHCLGTVPFETSRSKIDMYDGYPLLSFGKTSTYSVNSLINSLKFKQQYRGSSEYLNPMQQVEIVEFATKYGSYAYKGSVLELMSGIDLSCNNLTGGIPETLGNLSNILVLNLSHNHLTGPIPTTFSNLTAIESLDLSSNNLNGRVPLQLVKLHSLGTFNVAYNNLSGPLPDLKGQFATFDEKSYEGNPLLCGPPLLNTCSTGNGTEQTPGKGVNRDDDMVDFYASFGASYVTVLITIGAVLVINPRW